MAGKVSSARVKNDDPEDFHKISCTRSENGVLQAALFYRPVHYGGTHDRPRLFEFMGYVRVSKKVLSLKF
jgi:hypothetical protein